jgi:head-tail adaptor
MGRYSPNRPMSLEVATAIPDGAGGQALAWAPLGTIWVDLRAGGGGERLGPIAPEGRMGFRAYCRAAAQGSPQRPRPDQRLRDGARLFTILAVAEADPVGAWLVCLLREEVPA